jgi:NUDIX domain
VFLFFVIINPMTKWKRIGTKQILKHPRINVYEDDIELPNGTKTTYVHFGEARNSVTAIVIRADRKVLLQKEFSYPSGKWLYQFPGGGLAKGESAIQGIKREL